jgi:hypothetical protein
LSLALGGIYNAGPGRTSFAAADFNNDGVLDVAVDSPEGIAILLGGANGSLGSSRAFAAGKPALSGALGEFSGSDNLDAVVNIAASQALLLHGDGEGEFSAATTATTSQVSAAGGSQVVNLPGAPRSAGLVQTAMVSEDLDGDGNQDVVVAYDNSDADHAHPTAAAANAIYIWYGNRDGGFGAPVVMTPSRNFYELAVVDVNGDGRPDLIMSDGYVLGVQNNLGGRAFGKEEHLLAGMGINSISAGDVNKDGLADLVVANGGTVIANPAINSLTTAASHDVTTGGITVLLNRIKPKAAPSIPTTVVFTISTPSTIYFGQTVSGLALVTASDGSVPTGTISFLDDTTNICTIPVTHEASCPPNAGSGFAVGKHTLTAAYSGDATHLGSTSAPMTVTVLPLKTTTDTFSISVTGSTTTTVGGTMNLQIAVVPQTGYLPMVQLSCGDLPTEATCEFATQTIPGGGGITTLQLSVMPPRSCEVADSESRTAGLPIGSTTLAALIVTLLPGKRRAIKCLLVAVVAIFGMASLTGCSSCTDLGTKPGSYTIRVIGTEVGQVVSIVTIKVKLTIKE